jgi:dipeptidase D
MTTDYPPNLENSPLAGLEPSSVWRAFDLLRSIPRPSRHEERVVAAVRAWAADHGFEVRNDAAGNLVVVVPASPGHEKAPIVILQGHLDMVAEKNRGVDHDFLKDPIDAYIDGDWVKARGTTLGSDNGMGVAMAMAAATDPECTHGPLELLMTLDEETGLNGALQFDGRIAQGRILINIDSEDEGILFIGCAGAIAVDARFALERGAYADGRRFELSVSGLRGGHSGVEIHTHRGNANQALARVLVAARDRGCDFGLVAFQGGDKPNAIPRESFAELLLDGPAQECLAATVAELLPVLREELGNADGGLQIELKPFDGTGGAPFAADLRDRFLRALDAAPYGVLAMSPDMPGLVETSANLAVVKCQGDEASVLVGVRSSRNPSLATRAQSLESLFRMAGARTERTRGYPGWLPQPDAPLVARTVAVYERVAGAKPEITAVHAGLECGVLAEKLPGLDAISLGPDQRGAHSPDEKVSIPSVARTWRFLRELLADLAA